MRTRYAIGDVHGEADRLAQLHDYIAEDIEREGAPALIVHLGDLVDRGFDSRSVVARVIAMEAAPPAGAEARCVLGNHEQMMLDARRALPGSEEEESWLVQGGEETALSYMRANGARDDWRNAVDGAHWHWLGQLPTMVRDGHCVFVHAGIEPRLFPNCFDEIRIWTRSGRFFDSENWPDRDELRDIVVVHGHTPMVDGAPDVQARRINVDTGAVYGGPLTCVVLTPGEAPRFLYA